jgi:hypothetical protein
MLNVIGITGPKRSGKDTTAKLIECLADHQFIRLSLADPIKDGFDRISGASRDLHKDMDAAGWPTRRAWELAGTEARDLAGDNLIWCKLAKVWICYLAYQHPRHYVNFVIPDIRFPHEDDYFRSEIAALGGTYRLWSIRSKREVRDTSHASERHFDSFTPDARICNDVSRWDLAARVEHLINPEPPKVLR